jgi:hypothetical protein
VITRCNTLCPAPFLLCHLCPPLSPQAIHIYIAHKRIYVEIVLYLDDHTDTMHCLTSSICSTMSLLGLQNCIFLFPLCLSPSTFHHRCIELCLVTNASPRWGTIIPCLQMQTR